MKKIFFLLLLIFSWSKAYNQILKGTILDNDTKKPIDFAVAYFSGTFIGTTADKQSSAGDSIPAEIPIPMIEFQKLNTSLPEEKIYLHLDRPNYMQGDTIWFKAYSWFGYDQLPDTVSGLLYVDLFNPEGTVTQKKKLLIQNGTSVGEFSLDKNISPGRYTLRAYTRWMQNENTGESFYQTVTINAINQYFQVDCSPLLLKRADGDSLQATFRFYEIDQAGDLKNDFSHKVNYSVKIGNRLLNTGQTLAKNTKKQSFTCRLPEIGENDSVAILGLSISDERLTFEKQFRIPLKEEIDLQFFPEGGTLIDGLESKVAFKAIGTDGLSREVQGVIKDETGEVVTSFASSHKGMGTFLFTPKTKKAYSALVDFHHQQFKFNLPQAAEEGWVMSVGYTENELAPSLLVKYSPSKANASMYVVGSSYGKIRFVSPIKTTNDSSKVEISAALFPEGISRVTLFDSDFKARCERLIYIDKYQRLKIEIEPDSLSYSTRSKVTLKIKTTNQAGEAVPANLSLAVVDKDQIIKDGSTGGISAYKLLESELKGTIEDAAYYFRNDSCTNRDALDLLLLTQGYRRFLRESGTPAGIKYLPERSFEITGKVALPGNSKIDRKFNYSSLGLTLLCPSKNVYFDQTHPDTLGKFSFHLPFQFGKPLSLLRAFTSNGRLTPGKIPKERSFKGDILLTEAAAPPLFMPPLHSPIDIAAPAIDYIRQLQAVKRSERAKTANEIAWHLNLKEVTVKGRDKNWYTHFEEEANKIADMDSLDPTGKKYGNLYDLLIRDFGAREQTIVSGSKTVLLPCVSMGPSEYYPIYVINGQTYCNGGEDSLKFYTLLNMLTSVRVNEIKKLMVLPPGNIAYHYADPKILFGLPPIRQSLVAIETYSKINFYRGDPVGIKTFILDGLDTPRTFYSPRYKNPELKNTLYDGRATVHWEPSIQTDESGRAHTTFFTSDRQTDLKVIANGMDIERGCPGQGDTLLKVKITP